MCLSAYAARAGPAADDDSPAGAYRVAAEVLAVPSFGGKEEVEEIMASVGMVLLLPMASYIK